MEVERLNKNGVIYTGFHTSQFSSLVALNSSLIRPRSSASSSFLLLLLHLAIFSCMMNY